MIEKKWRELYFLRLAILSAIILVILMGCASTKVTLMRIQPPEYDIDSGKRLAVLDLAPAAGAEDSGRTLSSALVGKLAPAGFYKLMERAQIAEVIKEQEFGKSYYVEPGSAKEIGRLLGVDYVVVGEVTAYDIEDESGMETVSQQVETGQFVRDRKGRLRPVYKTVLVNVPVQIRRGAVAASFRMVDVETGEIIASAKESASFQKKATGATDISRLPAMSDLVSNLTDEVAGKFARRIAPYPVQEVKTLEYGKSDAVKQGVKLAKNGLWDEAIASWEGAVGAVPEDPAVYNNLGVAYEKKGMFDEAEEYYRKALTLKPGSKLYMRNIRHVQYLKKLYEK